MESKNLSAQVLIGGAMLSCILPVLIFKFAYLDTNKKVKAVSGELDTINQNMAVMDNVLKEPGIITGYIAEVAKGQRELENFKPSTTGMTSAQKTLARLAKENQVVIVALRPIDEGVPFAATGSAPEDSNDEESNKKGVLGILTGSIEIGLRGSYANIVSCIQAFETTPEVTLAIEHLNMISVEELDARFVEADIRVRLYYMETKS